jgi:hypothetical protein
MAEALAVAADGADDRSAEELIVAARIEIIKKHVLRVLSATTVALLRYELVNQIPCGFSKDDILKALEELAKEDRVAIDSDAGREDFATIHLLK